MEEEFVTELRCRNGKVAEKLEQVFAEAIAYSMFGIDETVHFGDPGAPATVAFVKEILDKAEQAGTITAAERQSITAVCHRIRELNI